MSESLGILPGLMHPFKGGVMELLVADAKESNSFERKLFAVIYWETLLWRSNTALRKSAFSGPENKALNTGNWS